MLSGAISVYPAGGPQSWQDDHSRNISQYADRGIYIALYIAGTGWGTGRNPHVTAAR
jgi:hypothetical protein